MKNFNNIGVHQKFTKNPVLATGFIENQYIRANCLKGGGQTSKQVIFSPKLSSNNLLYSPAKLNNNNITRCSHQKHLGVVLDSNLNFKAHIEFSN